jgi:SEC-C motif-containing protein
MRSRYTAYVMADIDYLLRTWHPSTRPDSLDAATIPDWFDLRIVRTEEGGEQAAQGVVEFVADAGLPGGEGWKLHEVSRFVREEGRWFYVDGKTTVTPSPTKTTKVGRNEPCTCGSGKKAKRCCQA